MKETLLAALRDPKLLTDEAALSFHIQQLAGQVQRTTLIPYADAETKEEFRKYGSYLLELFHTLLALEAVERRLAIATRAASPGLLSWKTSALVARQFAKKVINELKFSAAKAE